MEFKERLYLNFAKIFPNTYRNHMEKLFIYAGEKTNSDSYLGSSIILSLLAFITVIITSLLLDGPLQIKYIILAIIAVIIIMAIYYFIVYFKAAERTERIEKVVPDWLQLISSNLRAGMTPFQALKASSRKELGPLKEEIDRATTKSLGTEFFSQSLLQISGRIRSEILEKSLKLFSTAMKSGGHLANLLEELGKDIANTRNLKRELVTNTKTYTMFIMFTVIVGTPLLMVVAIHFLEVISNLQATTGTATAGFGLGFLAGEITITPEFLTKVAFAMLILTSSLACMLLGVIKEGKMKYGLKYSPIVIFGSFCVFYIVRHFISKFFG